MNKRRGLVVLAGTSVFVPRIAFCQQEGKLRRVGFLSFRGRPDSLERDFYGGFARGMRALGYAESKMVNLKTPKALDLTMPPEIMVQATRMIK